MPADQKTDRLYVKNLRAGRVGLGAATPDDVQFRRQGRILTVRLRGGLGRRLRRARARGLDHERRHTGKFKQGQDAAVFDHMGLVAPQPEPQQQHVRPERRPLAGPRSFKRGGQGLAHAVALTQSLQHGGDNAQVVFCFGHRIPGEFGGLLGRQLMRELAAGRAGRREIDAGGKILGVSRRPHGPRPDPFLRQGAEVGDKQASPGREQGGEAQTGERTLPGMNRPQEGQIGERQQQGREQAGQAGRYAEHEGEQQTVEEQAKGGAELAESHAPGQRAQSQDAKTGHTRPPERNAGQGETAGDDGEVLFNI